jgi:hypothetical protein
MISRDSHNSKCTYLFIMYLSVFVNVYVILHASRERLEHARNTDERGFTLFLHISGR